MFAGTLRDWFFCQPQPASIAELVHNVPSHQGTVCIGPASGLARFFVRHVGNARDECAEMSFDLRGLWIKVGEDFLSIIPVWSVHPHVRETDCLFCIFQKESGPLRGLRNALPGVAQIARC
jgi:hypothetical protein